MAKPELFDEVVILGMGFVGLTLAAVVAEAGHRVLGVDTNSETISNLNVGRASFYEPNLEIQINNGLTSGNLRFEPILAASQKKRIFIVSVGTPLKGNQLDSGAITSIISTLGECIQEGDLVLLRSTIPVGLTRKIKGAISSKTEKNFLLAMCPERTLEGSALEELRVLPQIVGAPDQISREAARDFFLTFAPKVVQVDSYEAAELAKLSSNIARDVRFGLANEIALACERFRINFEDVRIATIEDYPRDGLARLGPVAGPCLEKDSWIFLESLHRFEGDDIEAHLESSIIKSARLVNESLAGWAISNVNHYLTLKGRNTGPVRILHLGMAFKGNPPTNDLRGSDAIKVFNGLTSNGLNHNYSWDAEVSFEELNQAGLNPVHKDFSQVDFDIIIVHNNHSLNKKKVSEYIDFKKPGDELYILDLCNAIEAKKLLPSNVIYRAFGAAQNA